TIPKGKVDPGEDEQACALREVEEETGMACRTGRELASSEYTDRGGRPKQVRYWLMVPERTAWPPHGLLDNEVDEVEWVAFGNATKRLSYGRDREVLDSALDGLAASVREIEDQRGNAKGVGSRAT
ncbi:MAG: NUDIX hydrolase, partial [Thermoplasmata archaeon]